MNCETARDRLLEADLAELRGEGDGELAQHLRACSACRDRARRILEQTTSLGATLELARPRLRPVHQIRHRGTAGRVRGWRWAVGVPLALAAGLAVLLLRGPRGLPVPAGNITAPRTLAAAPLDVQAPPGRTVTVFQTDNPDIVVIWSF